MNDNLKEALQYLVELGKANVQDIILPDGTTQTYSDKPLHRLSKHIPMAKSVTVRTLTSLVDYIKSNIDTMSEKMLVAVCSPTKVQLVSHLRVKLLFQIL